MQILIKNKLKQLPIKNDYKFNKKHFIMKEKNINFGAIE